MNLFFIVSLLGFVFGVFTQCTKPTRKAVIVKKQDPDNENERYNKIPVPYDGKKTVVFETHAHRISIYANITGFSLCNPL
jgi:hypothetical protein